MNCALCFNREHQTLPTGKIILYKPGHGVKTMICGFCTNRLLALKIAKIPWDGDLKSALDRKKERSDIALRRRKGK